MESKSTWEYWETLRREKHLKELELWTRIKNGDLDAHKEYRQHLKDERQLKHQAQNDKYYWD